MNKRYLIMIILQSLGTIFILVTIFIGLGVHHNLYCLSSDGKNIFVTRVGETRQLNPTQGGFQWRSRNGSDISSVQCFWTGYGSQEEFHELIDLGNCTNEIGSSNNCTCEITEYQKQKGNSLFLLGGNRFVCSCKFIKRMA